jgi:hypothetical protein
LAKGVYFALEYDFHSSSFKAKIEPANACKE